MADFEYPDGDVATNSWTDQSGGTTNLYTAIDEVAASDSDYIQSPAAPVTTQYYEASLSDIADPLSSTGHIVHYRYEKNVSGGAANLTVGLYQGNVVQNLDHAAVGSFAMGATTGQERRAQSFPWPGGGSVDTVNLYLNKVGSPTDNFILALQADASGSPSGTDIVTASVAGSGLSTDNNVGALVAFNLNSGLLAAGTYWLVMRRSTAVNATNNYGIHGNTTNPYAGGKLQVYDSVATTWSDASSGNADAYFDIVNGPVASWSHTGISNAWTTQDQTLTTTQADAITDYSDLRLRFTPAYTANDQVPTFVADRASANSNTATTTVDLVLTGLTVGNYLIVRSAADNAGSGGNAVTFVPSNFSGTAMGTHTEYQQNNDPGVASAGVTCNVSVIKIAATSGTIRLTYGASVVQACVAEEWSGIDGTTPVVGTPVKANGVASTNLASVTDASIAAGNVAYGVVAVEGPSSDTYTQDADTTNGSWSSFNTVKLGTSIATADLNMTIYGGYKTVTAAGAQTYNPTINNARDSAGIILELAAAPATIRTQVSWANFELPSAAPTPSMPPLPFNRRTFRTLAVR